MKAICIKQPWASMIARGEKTIEIRTWKTSHRGEILIVASKSPEIAGLSSGQAIAIATLTACRPMRRADEQAACCKKFSGAVAWELTNISPIHPYKVKGRMGIFEVAEK